MIQSGGVYTIFYQKEGTLLQKYRDRNGRCIAMFLTSLGGQGSVWLSGLQAFRLFLEGVSATSA